MPAILTQEGNFGLSKNHSVRKQYLKALARQDRRRETGDGREAVDRRQTGGRQVEDK